MDETSLWPIYGGLIIASMASSLHCIGMCGPILVGFSKGFTALSVEGRAVGKAGGIARSTTLDFVWYHAGRLWTYGLLGWFAGWFGRGVVRGSEMIGWQRVGSVAIGVAVVISGVVLLGVIPRLRRRHAIEATPNPSQLFQCAALWRDTITSAVGSLIRSLTSSGGWISRLVLGMVMGFLPCGLVYAMLLTVAGLPTPLHSALGMVVFGLGTLPGLSAALLASTWLPTWIRAGGTRVAAACVIAGGAWMVGRAIFVGVACCTH